MIFGREPALILRAVSALLALFVAVGLPLAENASQALIALAAAVLGVIQAFRVRPVAPSVFATLIATGAATLAALDIDVGKERTDPAANDVLSGIRL